MNALAMARMGRWRVMMYCHTVTLMEREFNSFSYFCIQATRFHALCWMSSCQTNLKTRMYNIVRVKNGKYYNQFANAWIISDHYGYSTQFLTNASISCQNKYGGYGHFPYNLWVKSNSMSSYYNTLIWVLILCCSTAHFHVISHLIAWSIFQYVILGTKVSP